MPGGEGQPRGADASEDVIGGRGGRALLAEAEMRARHRGAYIQYAAGSWGESSCEVLRPPQSRAIPTPHLPSPIRHDVEGGRMTVDHFVS